MIYNDLLCSAQLSRSIQSRLSELCTPTLIHSQMPSRPGEADKSSMVAGIADKWLNDPSTSISAAGRSDSRVMSPVH